MFDARDYFNAKQMLAGTVRGEADFKSDGKTAQLDLRLQGGGGSVQAKATATLAKMPIWDLQLGIENLDPGALSSAAPHGVFNARASLHAGFVLAGMATTLLGPLLPFLQSRLHLDDAHPVQRPQLGARLSGRGGQARSQCRSSSAAPSVAADMPTWPW